MIPMAMLLNFPCCYFLVRSALLNRQDTVHGIAWANLTMPLDVLCSLYRGTHGISLHDMTVVY